MPGYYAERLSAERLRVCYDVAPPRTRAYLEAEIAFVLEHASGSARVLDMGCGYGRVLRRLAPRVRSAAGMDTALASLHMARGFVAGAGRVHLVAMDAARLGFADRTFDLTLCIQNGISAFHVDPPTLVSEAVRVTRPGGAVLFSTYAARFWEARLEWFEAQAAHGLVGEIDRDATGRGVIVCKDGFRSTTMDADGFRRLVEPLGLLPRIVEVDGSSLFCEIVRP
jgi:2-polyprenyl-6-hydroxyphenyl methylase/3-demethylubiquinone-9 3-methyltransferase